MPKARELTVAIQDKPGALAKCLSALAEAGINILGFQSYVEEGESLARFLVDDVPAATKILGGKSMIFEVTDVVVVPMAYKPGELARIASALGQEKINVNYCYSGRRADNSSALAVFGVDDLKRASALFDDPSSRI